MEVLETITSSYLHFSSSHLIWKYYTSRNLGWWSCRCRHGQACCFGGIGHQNKRIWLSSWWRRCDSLTRWWGRCHSRGLVDHLLPGTKIVFHRQWCFHTWLACQSRYSALFGARGLKRKWFSSIFPGHKLCFSCDSLCPRYARCVHIYIILQMNIPVILL